MGNVLNKSCRKNQNTILFSITFIRKSRRLRNNVEKYGGARGATNDVIIWRIRVACWIRTRMHTSMRIDTPTRPDTHTRTHEHAGIYNAYCLSSATMIRESASLSRHSYIACTVLRLKVDSSLRTKITSISYSMRLLPRALKTLQLLRQALQTFCFCIRIPNLCISEQS
jgi:hypothetical protein